MPGSESLCSNWVTTIIFFVRVNDVYEDPTDLSRPWDMARGARFSSYGPSSAAEGSFYLFSSVITPTMIPHVGWMRIVPHSFPGKFYR